MFHLEWKSFLYFVLWLLYVTFALVGSNEIPENKSNDLTEANASSPIEESSCIYPKNPFYFIVHWECPAMSPLCIIDTPFDSSNIFEFIRCSTAKYQANNSLELLSATEMLKQIESQLRNRGLLQCTLSAFYAPNCYFSAQMAPYLNALPRMFPRLKVVAVDASGNSKLYTRYGIIGTPTVILWVNGIPVSRMDEAPFSLESFRAFIENHTDLEGIYSVKVDKEDLEGPLFCEFEAPSWLFLMSAVSMILSITYFFIISSYAKKFFGVLRRRLWFDPTL